MKRSGSNLFLLIVHSSTGPAVILVGTTKLPYAQQPLMLHNGELVCQTQSGKTTSVHLSTYNFLERPQDLPHPEVSTVLWLADVLSAQGGDSG